MKKEEIKKGIAQYEKAQQILIQKIKEHGNALTSDKFDEIFADVIQEKKRDEHGRLWTSPMCNSIHEHLCIFFNPETFFLGSMSQGNLARWIDLAQLMVKLDILDCVREGDEFVYSVKEQP